MTELVGRFATSPERSQILRGLLAYRAALAGIGITQGLQWLDGSFVEDCETTRQRPPSDIDIVTFAYRPAHSVSQIDWTNLINANLFLFDPIQAKAGFQCDAYYVDLNMPPHTIVARTTYFNGLFSHHRDTAQWKGMVSVSLQSDDAQALQLI
jgi:hypothetical protein